MPDKKNLEKYFELIPFPENFQTLNSLLNLKNRTKPVFLYLEKIDNYKPGIPDIKLGGRSYEYFYQSMKLARYLENVSLITLPVSKELICKSGKKFHGHTEELEKFFSHKTVMCMYNPDLSVIPLTHHIPLKTVPGKILKVDFHTLGKAIKFFSLLTKFSKKIAMTGLNPHAGENGEIGNEEEFLKKAILILENSGLNVEGPLPADGLFMPANRKKYSLVLAAYHDQALIPFKALYGTSGLNITLNLPFLRVSPDHGPAYEFAGKNNADIQSVYKSLIFAIETGEKWIKLYSSL